MAYLGPDEGVLNVWVGSVEGNSFRPVTKDRGRGIGAVTWAADNRHLLYVQDHDGDENWHLHAVDLWTGGTRDLTPFSNVQARVVSISKRVPDRLLVGLNQRSGALHDLHCVDLVTGDLTMVAENPGFASWLIDGDLGLQGAVAWRPDGGATLVRREEDGRGWQPLYGVGYEDALTMRPVTFTADGKRLVILSSAQANTTRLMHLDLTTEDLELIFEDPDYDVVGVHTHPDTRRPQIAVVQRERVHWEVLDEAIRADVARVRHLSDGDPRLLGRDEADEVWLLQFNLDSGPAPYYVYRRRTGQGRLLFTHQPELEGFTLGRMEPFSYTARDGLTIHGYLTFPMGLPRRLLPTVLRVHGGPWSRDVWGYRSEAQWLANRGYLCLEVNFRGSTGYGKHFLNAGDREWGGRMQEDLIDAVKWIVDQSYADPQRIAIYGTSYGGYAALVASTFTPDFFRCAISVAGPSNLKSFIQSMPAYGHAAGARIRARIGDPVTQSEMLWERSPLSRVHQIRIPILIAQGANDPRVRREESEKVVAAMRQNGLPHEYMLFADEGHGFVRPENRLAFYATAERFLAQHLGGRHE